MYGEPMGTRQRYIERYHRRPPTASPCVGIDRDSPNCWISPINSGRGKATDSRDASELKVVKNFGQEGP